MTTLAVVIPSFKVKEHILGVIQSIPPEVQKIYVVDDKCPQSSGAFVQSNNRDPRVRVLFHDVNRGVGGAMVTGFQEALKDNIDVVIKIDGDGQMDPKLIPLFVEPIANERADYVKGNRFYSLEDLSGMPGIRLFGNMALSFINKLVTGYWDVMDPTNGYTAVHSAVLRAIPLQKLDNRYFFESDMLFRLSTLRAVIQDVPMRSHYADEISNLNITRVLFTFPGKYLKRFLKRIVYNYYLRDFNFGSMMLVVGLLLMTWGLAFGSYYWYHYHFLGVPAPSGTVMAAALPVILGFQSIIYFFQADISSVPKQSIHRGLKLYNQLRKHDSTHT